MAITEEMIGELMGALARYAHYSVPAPVTKEDANHFRHFCSLLVAERKEMAQIAEYLDRQGVPADVLGGSPTRYMRLQWLIQNRQQVKSALLSTAIERDALKVEVGRLRGIIIEADNHIVNDHPEQAARLLAAEVESESEPLEPVQDISNRRV